MITFLFMGTATVPLRASHQGCSSSQARDFISDLLVISLTESKKPYRRLRATATKIVSASKAKKLRLAARRFAAPAENR